MAKSKNVPYVVDDDGKAFAFNKERFNTELKKTKAQTHKTINNILYEIQAEYGLGVDAMQSWQYGKTGVGSIDNVKTLARALKLKDYHELLTSISKTQEDNEMVEKTADNKKKALTLDELYAIEIEKKKNAYIPLGIADKKLIWKVYGDCVSVVYCIADYFQNGNKGKEEFRPFQNECDKIIRKAQLFIDQSGMVITSRTKYHLHRILMECRELYGGPYMGFHLNIPYAWDDIGEFIIPPELDCIMYFDRHEYLDGYTDEGYYYLINEIILGDALDLSDCVEPTQEQWDNALEDVEDLSVYGYTSGEINPHMVAVDMLIAKITAVFRKNFPEAFENSEEEN